MRTFVIGLFLMGFATLGFSQNYENPNDKFDEVTLTEVTVKPVNYNYLQSVQDDHTPAPVRELEELAASYDVKRSNLYNGSFEGYEVKFQRRHGGIVATYDKEGNITSSLERFTHLTLPSHIRNAVYEENPGWTIHRDAYMVSYFNNKDRVKKIYKVQVRKGKSRKNLKFDSDGNRI